MTKDASAEVQAKIQLTPVVSRRKIEDQHKRDLEKAADADHCLGLFGKAGHVVQPGKLKRKRSDQAMFEELNIIQNVIIGGMIGGFFWMVYGISLIERHLRELKAKLREK